MIVTATTITLVPVLAGALAGVGTAIIHGMIHGMDLLIHGDGIILGTMVAGALAGVAHGITVAGAGAGAAHGTVVGMAVAGMLAVAGMAAAGMVADITITITIVVLITITPDALVQDITGRTEADMPVQAEVQVWLPVRVTVPEDVVRT